MATITLTVKTYATPFVFAAIRLATPLAPRWPRLACSIVNFACHWLLWSRIQPRGRLFRVGQYVDLSHERDVS